MDFNLLVAIILALILPQLTVIIVVCVLAGWLAVDVQPATDTLKEQSNLKGENIMDHTKILKRAWAILWQYRVLWIFGIILAITASSSSPANTSQLYFQSERFQ